MMRKLLMLGVCALSLSVSGCTALEGLLLSDEEKLEREIELERKKQELDRLRNAAKPTPGPSPEASPTPVPKPGNQSPQIQVLDAVLASTARNNDTVRVIVKASDADGDALEYNWTSVYTGLSSTKGEQVVWFPTADLKGKTNIITVSVSDKKGGTSTASLNVFVQADGTLLVREDTANKPVLNALLATRSDDGRVLLRATATDPAGGLLRYQWTASAGQLSTPAASASIWQANGASGEIDLKLVVSNASGLQAEGSFRFERRPDGSLVGGFTGTDLQLPSSGISLDAGGGLSSELQLVGQALLLQENELIRWNPATRTRTTLVSFKGLSLPGGTVQQADKLIYQAPAKKAFVTLNVIKAVSSDMAVAEVDLESGKVSQVVSLPYAATVTTRPERFYLDQGQLKTQFVVYGQAGSPGVGNWLGEIDGSDFEPEAALPADLKVLAISPRGQVFGQRGDMLVLFEPESGDESELLSLNKAGLNYGLEQCAFSHKGNAVACVHGSGFYGSNRGIAELHLFGLDGRHRVLWTNSLQTDIQTLRWSLDDLYLSWASYPYAYLQSPSDRRARLGSLSLLEVDRPENQQKLKLEFSENANNQLEWVP